MDAFATGSRGRAGRPRKSEDEKRQGQNVSFYAEDLERIRAICAERGGACDLSSVVRDAVGLLYRYEVERETLVADRRPGFNPRFAKD